MKSRPNGGAPAAAAAAQRKKRNQQRLGGRGGGLSLEAFANAKSNATGYNPALIRGANTSEGSSNTPFEASCQDDTSPSMDDDSSEKKREFYKNVKVVKKYKKSLEQQNHSKQHLPATSIPESQDGNENEKRSKKKRKNGSLESIRKEYEKRQEEKERARQEREAIIQAKKEEREQAEARRKALREKMFKRTSSGQPVMKYRIEHLLENILRSSSN